MYLCVVNTNIILLLFPQGCSELIQHKLMLVADVDNPKQQSLGSITVSVIFRHVPAVGTCNSQCHVSASDRTAPLLLGGVVPGKKRQSVKLRSVKNKRRELEGQRSVCVGVHM